MVRSQVLKSATIAIKQMVMAATPNAAQKKSAAISKWIKSLVNNAMKACLDYRVTAAHRDANWSLHSGAMLRQNC
jgi:hypothetical protein